MEAYQACGVAAFRSCPKGTEQPPILQEVNYVYQDRESSP